MAIPKKGSRKIVVNDIAYRWLIRRKATYTQVDYGDGNLHVAIELYEQPKGTLVFVTDRPHPHDLGNPQIIPITPVDIQRWIQEAISLKWNPTQHGASFQVIIDNGIMKASN